jgi:hypothetical protein
MEANLACPWSIMSVHIKNIYLRSCYEGTGEMCTYNTYSYIMNTMYDLFFKERINYDLFFKERINSFPAYVHY